MRHAITFLLSITLLVFFGCDANPLFQHKVLVKLASVHPWEEASLKKLWHTLVWTDGLGKLQSMHLGPGQRQAYLSIPKGKTTVICAYPLGDMLPYGGFFSLDGKGTILLSQDKGELAKLLLDAFLCNPEAVQSIDAEALFALCPKPSLMDRTSLTVALLNGNWETKLFNPLEANLSDLPSGYWVPERITQKPFFSQWGGTTLLNLEGGVQRWWCRERSLKLVVYADLQKRTFSSFLSTSSFW